MKSTPNPFPGAVEVPRLHKNTSGQTVPEYAIKGRKFVSLVQVLLGFVLLLCGVLILTIILPIATGYCDGFHKSSVGIWCGVVFILTGIIGAYSTKKRFLMTLYLAFGIFTCVLSAAGICVSSLAVVVCAYEAEEKYTTMKTLYSILIAVYVLGMLSSVVGTSFSCSGLEGYKQAPTVIYYNYDGAPTGPPMDSATLTNQQIGRMETNDNSNIQNQKPNDPISKSVDEYFTVVEDPTYSQKIYGQ